jgi:hypothetical protein
MDGYSVPIVSELSLTRVLPNAPPPDSIGIGLVKFLLSRTTQESPSKAKKGVTYRRRRLRPRSL